MIENLPFNIKENSTNKTKKELPFMKTFMDEEKSLEISLLHPITL